MGDEIQASMPNPDHFIMRPSVSALNGEGFVIVWQRQDSVEGLDIEGQRFYDDGTTYGDQFQINVSDFSSVDPAIALMNSSNIGIAWTSVEQDGSLDGVFGRIGDPVSPIPHIPSHVTASYDGSDIQVSWQDNSDNEEGFRIYVKEDVAGVFTEIHQTTADETAYTHAGVLPATTYFYKVTAVNVDGESSPSNVYMIQT